MTGKEKMELLMLLNSTLWNAKKHNADQSEIRVLSKHLVGNGCRGRWFVQGTVRGFDFDVRTPAGTVQLRMIEQNPNKTDNAGNIKPHALLARQGHCIVWVIDRNGSFLGRIQDGKWIASEQRAVQPAPATMTSTAQVAAEMKDPIRLEELPDVGVQDIDEFVLDAIANDEDAPEGIDYDLPE